MGIESTCDESGVAILTSEREILADEIATQWHLHKQHGGVVPALAQRQHQENLPKLVETALTKAQITMNDIDIIAVGAGPGLPLCLSVGTSIAQSLATQYSKPLVSVNHLVAHSTVSELTQPNLRYPHLTLLVSGGHTELWIARGPGLYDTLGSTLDDAVGEAYDKVARLLGLFQRANSPLESPGATLERIALAGSESAIPLPLPLRDRKGCDFSYAGLKSAVRRYVLKKNPQADKTWSDANSSSVSDEMASDVCASFQAVAVSHLRRQTIRAMQWAKGRYPDCKQLVLCGGVASNQYIRDKMKQAAEAEGFELVVPPRRHCSDNGVMIAWTGYKKYLRGDTSAPEHNFDPNWSVGHRMIMHE